MPRTTAKEPDKKAKKKSKDDKKPEQEAKKPKQKKKSKKKQSKFVVKVVLGCVGALVIAVGAWLAVVVPTLLEAPPEPVVVALTPEQIAKEKARLAEEAEESATWQTYHCDLFRRYYEGVEEDPPVAEIIGLSGDADEKEIRNRRKEFLPAVKLMGGWPNSQPQQDNMVVCEGFEFILRDAGNLVIRPTKADLANNQVAYGILGRKLRKLDLVDGFSAGLDNYAPIVTQAGDRCVIVAMVRAGRLRNIAARIVRSQ